LSFIAWVLYKFNPNYFARDIELVEKVGRSTEIHQVDNAISNYFIDCGFKRSLLHDKLNIRISCKTLLNIASQIFEIDDSES